MQPVQDWSPFTAKVLNAFLINVGVLFFMFAVAMLYQCITMAFRRIGNGLAADSQKKRT